MCRVTDAALSAICGLRKSGGHHHAVDLDERIAQMHINSESQQDSSGQLALAKPAPRYFGSKHQRRAPADDTTVELSRRKCHLQSLDAQFMTRCVNTLNLRVLNLSCNKLVKLPEAVTLLRNLEQLYVSNNQLVELPANISKLTNLKVLDVSSNRLEELPEGVTRCTQLETLRVGAAGGGNPVHTLPESLGLLVNLVELQLDNLQLTSLPGSIVNLTKLRALNAKNNRLQSLPEGMERMAALEWVDVSHNNISRIPSGVAAMPSLRMLNVSFNALQSIPCELTRECTPCDNNSGVIVTHHVNLVLAGNPLLSQETAIIPLVEPAPVRHAAYVPSLFELALGAALSGLRGGEVGRQELDSLPLELQAMLRRAPRCSVCSHICTQPLCEPRVVSVRAVGYTKLPVVASAVCQQCAL